MNSPGSPAESDSPGITTVDPPAQGSGARNLPGAWRGAARFRRSLGIEELRRRFDLVVRSHRVRDFDLRVAEVAKPDEMVRELYPDAVCEHGDAPVWMITWPAALALAEHLAGEVHAAGASLLELGCGTAAPGIAAHLAGARVLCTDYDPLALEMARHNARLNGCPDIEVRHLDWYRPDLDRRFDLVVGSEVVYFEKSFASLLALLKTCTAPGGRILLADQQRPQMRAFLEICRREGFRHRERTHPVHLPDRSCRIRIVEMT